jgi:hypothetical protein
MLQKWSQSPPIAPEKRSSSFSKLNCIFGLFCLQTEAIWHSQKKKKKKKKKNTMSSPTKGLLEIQVLGPSEKPKCYKRSSQGITIWKRLPSVPMWRES